MPKVKGKTTDEPLVSVGSKVPQSQHDDLRWLAYKRNTTISALVAAYIGAELSREPLLLLADEDRGR